MDKYDRYNNAVAGLVRMHIPRRRALKAGLGLGLGAVGLGALSNCGPEQAPAAAPTATSAPAAAAPATTAPTATTANEPTATTALGSPPVSDGANYWEKTASPYGGSGIADKAIEVAKAETNKNPLGIVYPAGTRPNIEGLIPEWKNQTGIDVKLFEVPSGEISTKVMEGAVTKESSWDLVTSQVKDMGDLAGAAALVDWTDYANELGEIFSGKPWGYMGQQGLYNVHYRGRVYSLYAGGDVWLLTYRKDLFEDPKEREGFQQKYGYEMKMDTWDQFRDVCAWFTRPDQNMYGANMPRAKYWGFWWWELHYGIKAFPNQLYFDDDMHPLINSPEGIAATKDFLSFKPYSHPDISDWDWTQAYPLYSSGSAFSMINWPSIVKFANDPGTSKVVGKNGYTLIPGEFVGDKFNRKSLMSYGSTLMGWKYGKASQKAAYAFAQWITSPEIAPKVHSQLGYWSPTRYNEIGNPLVTKHYPGNSIEVLAQNCEMALPDIFMQGANEYTLALDANTHAAWTGSMTPEQAMEETAKTWEDITDRVGRDTLKEVWATLQTYYPTTVLGPVRKKGDRDTEPA